MANTLIRLDGLFLDAELNKTVYGRQCLAYIAHVESEQTKLSMNETMLSIQTCFSKICIFAMMNTDFRFFQ